MSRGQTVVGSYDLKGVQDMLPFALDLPAPALFNNLINKLLFVCGSLVIVRTPNLLHKNLYMVSVGSSLGQNTSRGKLSPRDLEYEEQLDTSLRYIQTVLSLSMGGTLSN